MPLIIMPAARRVKAKNALPARLAQAAPGGPAESLGARAG